MDRVFFEGIRCFYSRQEVPLAPVTILVGENSSGKSTALALIRLAWDVLWEEEPDFNQEPFLLGAYEQIASFHGKALRPPTFTIGWATEAGTVTGHFVADRGQPQLKKRDVGSSSELISPLIPIPVRPYAFAPVRTKPLRTYDPIKGAFSPDGDHVPLVLAVLARSSSWQALASSLESFGRHSGLFTAIDVRQLGTSEGDPFQIQVHIGHKAVNLIDVGYGVSQILPIVVDSLAEREGSTFLLQQPEVHLHPHAQAELGSFLAVLAKQQNKRFVIETHSDYLVDRIRMDIRDKKGITPDDVALLYFERKNGEATIHRLELDDQGNIVNAPPGYRRPRGVRGGSHRPLRVE